MRISKRILCTFLVVLIALMSAPLQGFVEIGQTDLFSTKASAASDYSDYIPIFDANDLKAISENLDAKYILIKDIDLASENWTPIGTESAPFTGIFDGNGNTISNLNISGTYANGAQIGLFGYANGAELTNVKLKNVQINILGTTASNAYLSIGPICGVIKNTIIDKCDADGNIVCSAEKGNYVRVAGIVGESYSSSSITNCLSSCSLVGNAKSQNCMVGGITAWLGASSIAKCLFAGSINAGTSSTYVYCGGIGASGDCGISESVVLASELNNNGISSAYGTSLNGYICWRNTSNNRVLTGISGNVTGLRGSGNSMITEEQAVNQNTYTDMDWDFNDIWFMDNGYPSLRHNATCENVDAWESAGEQFPEGYDFDEDSYRFANYGDTISKKYFTTLYGTDNGKLLYKNQKKQGGLCFGFSYTTAALNNGLPDCSIISTFDKGLFNYKFCDNIRDIWNLSVDFIDLTTHSTKIVSSAFIVGDNTITIEDYIKYAHIYQYSENVDNGSVWTDGNTILALVREYTNNDRIGVTIGMTRRDGKGGHRVLAVGYDENDILVDDPNYKDEYKRIHVNSDGSWSFNGLTGYNSNTCDIRYNLDFHVPYQLLLTGQTTTVAEKWIDDQYNVSEHYIEGMDILNKDCCLVAINAEDYTVENENLTKIITEEIESAENDESSDLYWLPKDKTITVSDFSGENNLIEFSGNGKILSLETNADGSVTFDTGDTEINVQTKENEDYYLQIEECYQDEEFNDLSDIVIISGTANGDEVTATETEDGIQVTGLNNITVTYETADGTAETTAKVDDGSTVNITVNDDENTVKTDWQCKHPDENHDGICDTCSEDFTKSCLCSCHSNAFMQFLHKILCFLYRIFGMEQYRYCGCGKAHW